MKQTGSGNKGLDWVIILGMLAAFPKTADLLSYWSPTILNDIFGMDMSLFYGGFCAILVEGTVLFLHFDRRAHHITSAQVVKWILFGVSFACNIFDGFVTTDTVTQLSPWLRFLLTYGVPALPLIIALLVTTIGALPDDETPRTWKGLKNMLPDPRRIWEGDELSDNKENTVFSSHPNPAVPPAPKSDNGEHELDFPSRQRR